MGAAAGAADAELHGDEGGAGAGSLPRRERRSTSRADAVFHFVTAGSATLVLLIVGAIVAFLGVEAWPALHGSGAAFLTTTDWFPDATPPSFGIAALLFGSLMTSALALLLAVPVALGTAITLVELAPRRVGRWIGYLVELLAAVPSVIYGLWGLAYLVPALVPIEEGIDDLLGFIPILHSTTDTYGRSLFAASVVLAIMVLPIVTAMTREVFAQVPRAHREAAVALGATRWEVIRLAVLPYGRSGVVAAAMLGLGRALGETIAVALVLSAAFQVNWHIFEPGGNSIAANIATKFGESGPAGRDALIASGLVLFAVTLLVNVVARRFVARSAVRS
jgi:phosphate transport system permease protein